MNSEFDGRRGYLICSEARTGTTWFGRLLRSTGLLGTPSEVFADPGRARLLESRPGYFELLLDQATTPNGVYGFKIMSSQVGVAGRAHWVSRLPALSFVYLERRDVLGQAISGVRATQTGQFRAEHTALREPRYDRIAISRELTGICHRRARWHDYFARNGIQPLCFEYEGIAAAPQAAVAAIAELMGVRDCLPEAFAPGITIQRDAISAEWRSRFLAETRALDAMPGFHFSPRDAAREAALRLGEMLHSIRRFGRKD